MIKEVTTKWNQNAEHKGFVYETMRHDLEIKLNGFSVKIDKKKCENNET